MIKHIIGICPTYNRPAAVANAVAQWLAQDCSIERKLIVLDDGGQFNAHDETLWRLVSHRHRIETLGKKFDVMLGMAAALASDLGWSESETLVAVWEDDDVYSSGYLASHIKAIESTGKRWSAPSKILANDSVGFGKSHESDATGRHHGAWAYTLDAALQAGGYPHYNGDSNGNGFDIVFGNRMRETHGEPVDCFDGNFQYVYRWFTAGRNGSAFGVNGMMQQQGTPEFIGDLVPELDKETEIYWKLN